MKKNWYDDLTDEQIDKLKNNKIPFGLLSDEERELFERVNYTLLEFYYASHWNPMGNRETFGISFAYRLKPTWERPQSQANFVLKEDVSGDPKYLYGSER